MCLCICCITREIPKRHGLPNRVRLWIGIGVNKSQEDPNRNGRPGTNPYCKQSMWGGCVAEKRDGHHPPQVWRSFVPPFPMGHPSPHENNIWAHENPLTNGCLYRYGVSIFFVFACPRSVDTISNYFCASTCKSKSYFSYLQGYFQEM